MKAALTWPQAMGNQSCKSAPALLQTEKLRFAANLWTRERANTQPCCHTKNADFGPFFGHRERAARLRVFPLFYAKVPKPLRVACVYPCLTFYPPLLDSPSPKTRAHTQKKEHTFIEAEFLSDNFQGRLCHNISKQTLYNI